MTPTEWVLVASLVGVTVLAFLCVGAAYRNGITDGYGYSREPTCPGYAYAGIYLRRFMAHRWPELGAKVPCLSCHRMYPEGERRAGFVCVKCRSGV